VHATVKVLWEVLLWFITVKKRYKMTKIGYDWPDCVHVCTSYPWLVVMTTIEWHLYNVRVCVQPEFINVCFWYIPVKLRGLPRDQCTKEQLDKVGHVTLSLIGVYNV